MPTYSNKNIVAHAFSLLCIPWLQIPVCGSHIMQSKWFLKKRFCSLQLHQNLLWQLPSVIYKGRAWISVTLDMVDIFYITPYSLVNYKTKECFHVIGHIQVSFITCIIWEAKVWLCTFFIYKKEILNWSIPWHG